MAYLYDKAFDTNGLDALDEDATRLDLCSTEPANYAGIAAVTLANKTSGLSIGAVTDRTPNGRKRVLAAITDPLLAPVGTAAGTAAFWALSNGSNLLVATGAISPTVAVTIGAKVLTSTVDIGFADATAG